MTKLLHEDANERTLEFARTFVWLLWFGSIFVLPLQELSHLPAVAHSPTGMMGWVPVKLISLILTKPVLLGIQLLALLAILFTVVRPKQIVSPLVGCVLITLIQSLVRGFGHVNHAEIGLLLAAYTLTYFDMVRVWISCRPGEDANKSLPSPGAPVISISFLLCMTYSLTGLCRLGDGGLGVFASQSLTAWHQVATLTPRYYELDLGAALMQNPLAQTMFEAGYPVITAFEIFAPLCLVSLWFRRAFLLAMIPFHIMTVMLMGILFWENLVLYVFLVDLSGWFQKEPTSLVRGLVPTSLRHHWLLNR